MSRSRWLLKRGRLTPHILEEDVVEEITTRLLWQYRIKVYRVRERIPGRGEPSTPGIPDLVGWIPTGRALTPHGARPLFIECKRPGGAHRTAQIRFIDDAKSDGCVAGFCESWQDVVNLLAEYGIRLSNAA